jgi:branched-chain amino acid transport system ATP-binding protein
VPESLLSLENVSVAYGGSVAVFGATLTVNEGEIVGLLGPNGAGKTTTLLTIAGFLRSRSGRIVYNGADIGSMPAHLLARRGVGLVPDDRGLVSGLTVAENLALVRNRAADPYEIFPELSRLANVRAGVLSGGEQQMLALARVLAARPKLLLIDELSLGLAPAVVTRLLAVLRDAVRDFGTAVLLVEQHIEQALANADRAYIMVRGRTSEGTDAAFLRENPELIEASYLGVSTLSGA